MSDNILTLEEFLVSDVVEKEFVSEVWRKKQGDGSTVPGVLRYRVATVADREMARKAAKKGDQFDNAAYGVALIGACLISPKVNAMDLEALKQKNGKEMDRLLTAVIGDMQDDPR